MVFYIHGRRARCYARYVSVLNYCVRGATRVGTITRARGRARRGPGPRIPLFLALHRATRVRAFKSFYPRDTSRYRARPGPISLPFAFFFSFLVSLGFWLRFFPLLFSRTASFFLSPSRRAILIEPRYERIERSIGIDLTARGFMVLSTRYITIHEI